MKDEPSIQNLCLHTHNFFCDGKENINTLINSAVLQGVTQIGISSHAPLKILNKWSMNYNQLDNYRNEIADLKNIYQDEIMIFTSLEMDYIPGKTYDFDFFRKSLDLDYGIGSIHLVLHPEKDELWFIDGDKTACIENMNRIFDGDVKQAVQSFFAQSREMIKTQQPDIIGHLDKVIMNTGHLFDTSEKWYQDEIDATLKEIKNYNVIVEANTRGIYKGKWKETFPGKAILQKCFDLEIPILISSDAHRAEELCLGYSETRKMLKQIGYRNQQGRINSNWGNIPI
jgi:histidinol-phosphatase (PHP family)